MIRNGVVVQLLDVVGQFKYENVKISQLVK